MADRFHDTIAEDARLSLRHRALLAMEAAGTGLRAEEILAEALDLYFGRAKRHISPPPRRKRVWRAGAHSGAR